MKEYIKGTALTNEEILQELQSTTVTHENKSDIVHLLALLVTKKPVVSYTVRLGRSKLSEYLKNSPYTYSTLHTILQSIQSNGLFQRCFEAFETDERSRNIMIFVHEQRDNNRVPYLNILIKSLSSRLDHDISTVSGLIALFNDPRTMPLINDWISKNQLKFYGGATNTKPHYYDWILTKNKAKPNLDTIRNANYRIDLGGGFTTAEISRLLGAEFISHDIVPPTKFSEDMIFLDDKWYDDKAAWYVEEAKKAQFKYFDVFENTFERGHGSYVITSFGFLTSTVTSQSPSELNEKSVPSTLTAGLSRIVELVADEPDVYCYWLSRGTRRLYQNTVIQLRWKNGNLVNHKILSHPYSNYDSFKAVIRNDILFTKKALKDDV
jgi:hypothetical protein